VIATLRRRLDGLKQTMATKDAELRQKQREIDLLYGKLARVVTYMRKGVVIANCFFLIDS
jgi:hypothetical protein